MIIDCHAHLVPPSLLDAMRAQARAVSSVRLIEDGGSLAFSFCRWQADAGPVSKGLSDIPARLRWMDEQTIRSPGQWRILICSAMKFPPRRCALVAAD